MNKSLVNANQVAGYQGEREIYRTMHALSLLKGAAFHFCRYV